MAVLVMGGAGLMDTKDAMDFMDVVDLMDLGCRASGRAA